MRLHCFFDGGNKADSTQHDVVTLAVVCGITEQIKPFDRDWMAVLRKHDVPLVHTTDAVSLKGRPVLVDFIYTTCPGPCPLMTTRMAAVAKLLGSKLGKQVTFVSISIDPEHDRPAELEKYARAHGADEAGWLFLTGTPAQIDRVLALYHLERMRNPDGTLNHAVASFLLGPDGHQVRQYQPLEVKASAVVTDIDRVLGRS